MTHNTATQQPWSKQEIRSVYQAIQLLQQMLEQHYAREVAELRTEEEYYDWAATLTEEQQRERWIQMEKDNPPF